VNAAAGGWESWSWDESLFSGAAGYYEQGRASAVATMLDPGGAVVQVDAPGYRARELAPETRRGTLPFPPPPDDALDQLRRRYLGSDRRAGRGIRNTSPDGEDAVFRQAGFLPAQTVTVPDQRTIERTADEVVAWVFSSSSTAPHLFGDRRKDYETDMREILAQASPPGRFSVRLPDNILRIWRLPALPGTGPSSHSWRARPGHSGRVSLTNLYRYAYIYVMAGNSDIVGEALSALAPLAVRRRSRELSLTVRSAMATLERTEPRRLTDLAVSEPAGTPSPGRPGRPPATTAGSSPCTPRA
jgi:hypothetical protein